MSTAAGIDSIYQTPRAEDYTYGAIVAGTNDLAAKLTGIARMTNNTEYRFRVRHPGEEWSESASFRTPTYASDRDPRPDEPTEPLVVLLTNFDCEPTLDSYCRPPIAPQFVDIIYAPGSVEIVWEIMEHGGGQDHNGRAIPVARVSIVNDRWAACPFGSFQVAQSARPNFETCDGRRAGSGRKFIGSFTESIQAWLVEFRAQARNPQQGAVHSSRREAFREPQRRKLYDRHGDIVLKEDRMPTLKQFEKDTGIEAKRWKEVVAAVREQQEKIVVLEDTVESLKPTPDPVKVFEEEEKVELVSVRDICDEEGFPIDRILYGDRDEHGIMPIEPRVGIKIVEAFDGEARVDAANAAILRKWVRQQAAEERLVQYGERQRQI